MKDKNYQPNIFWQRCEPYLLSQRQLRRRYGPLVASVGEALQENFAERRPLRQASLCLQSIRFAFTTLVKVIRDDEGDGMVAAPLFATRGTVWNGRAEAEPSSGASCHAVADGNGCRGQIQITETDSGRVNFSLALSDEQGHRIRPFLVTVLDEKGRPLRERVRVVGWEGGFSQIKMGHYTFRIEDEAGERRVEIGVEPR